MELIELKRKVKALVDKWYLVEKEYMSDEEYWYELLEKDSFVISLKIKSL